MELKLSLLIICQDRKNNQINRTTKLLEINSEVNFVDSNIIYLIKKLLEVILTGQAMTFFFFYWDFNQFTKIQLFHHYEFLFWCHNVSVQFSGNP